MATLTELFDLYGSDKNASQYINVYIEYFEPIRPFVTSVLEIGLGTVIPDAPSSMHNWKTSQRTTYQPGASIRAWRDYFPNAQIYGGDIQPDTQFTEERIQTFLFDSCNPNECVMTLGDHTFDIIVDDGHHHPYSQVKTFYNLCNRIRPGGFYVIEDITPNNSSFVLEQLRPVIQMFGAEAFLLEPAHNLLILQFISEGKVIV